MTSCSIPSYDPREGVSDGGGAIIKTLDNDLFINVCGRCGDNEYARIRWVEKSKEGENSYTYFVGQACANAKSCKTHKIAKTERFVGCCFRCAENFLCYECAWERAADRGVVPPLWQRTQLDDGPAWPSTTSQDLCWLWEQGPGACYNGRFCGNKHTHRPGIRRNRFREGSYYGGSMD